MTSILVTNISTLLAENHIRELFAVCGDIVECTLTGNGDSRECRIKYKTPEQVKAAVFLSGTPLGDTKINVTAIDLVPQPTPTPMVPAMSLTEAKAAIPVVPASAKPSVAPGVAAASQAAADALKAQLEQQATQSQNSDLVSQIVEGAAKERGADVLLATRGLAIAQQQAASAFTAEQAAALHQQAKAAAYDKAFAEGRQTRKDLIVQLEHALVASGAESEAQTTFEKDEKGDEVLPSSAETRRKIARLRGFNGALATQLARKEQIHRTVYVGAIPPMTQVPHLTEWFHERCGPVECCRVAGNLSPTATPGAAYAFVEFVDWHSQIKALLEHGSDMKGYIIKVGKANNPIVRPNNIKTQTKISEAMKKVMAAQAALAAKFNKDKDKDSVEGKDSKERKKDKDRKSRDRDRRDRDRDRDRRDRDRRDRDRRDRDRRDRDRRDRDRRDRDRRDRDRRDRDRRDRDRDRDRKRKSKSPPSSHRATKRAKKAELANKVWDGFQWCEVPPTETK